VNIDKELHNAKHRSDEREIQRLNRVVMHTLNDMTNLANELHDCELDNELYRHTLIGIQTVLKYNKIDMATRHELIAMIEHVLGDDDIPKAS